MALVAPSILLVDSSTVIVDASENTPMLVRVAPDGVQARFGRFGAPGRRSENRGRSRRSPVSGATGNLPHLMIGDPHRVGRAAHESRRLFPASSLHLFPLHAGRPSGTLSSHITPGPRSQAIDSTALTLAAFNLDADTLWKVAAVTLYAAVLLVIGYVASKRMTDIRDYFVGGKKLGFINVAFSARATGESAWLLLGLTGMGYAVGVHAFWVVLGEMIGVGGAWLLMAKRFKRLTDRYDSVTVPD